MLQQTKRVEDIKKTLKKISKIIGVFAIALFTFSSMSYLGNHVEMAVLNNFIESNAIKFQQVMSGNNEHEELNQEHHGESRHHGPMVQSSGME